MLRVLYLILTSQQQVLRYSVPRTFALCRITGCNLKNGTSILFVRKLHLFLVNLKAAMWQRLYCTLRRESVREVGVDRVGAL
jgi:hypothetical protein